MTKQTCCRVYQDRIARLQRNLKGRQTGGEDKELMNFMNTVKGYASGERKKGQGQNQEADQEIQETWVSLSEQSKNVLKRNKWEPIMSLKNNFNEEWGLRIPGYLRLLCVIS